MERRRLHWDGVPMSDNKKSTDLGKLAREYNRRCELEAIERLQAENENLKAKIENRDLNIRHLTKLLKLAGTVRFNIEKTIENIDKPCPDCNYEDWLAVQEDEVIEWEKARFPSPEVTK
jgi:DNA replicative helicase MCM subunit Mcm2 (Cdc46/Mcm family)